MISEAANHIRQNSNQGCGMQIRMDSNYDLVQARGPECYTALAYCLFVVISEVNFGRKKFF